MPVEPAAIWRRIRGPLGRFSLELLPVAPFALLLAFALGFTVTIGAELAHAYPSEAAPYGWNGPASFDAGVATMRPQLVLAATIPALLLGLMSTRRFRVGLTGPLKAGGLLAADLGLIAIGAWLGAVIAHMGAAKTTNEAFWAFAGAHLLLAASFYALAVLSSVVLRRAPALLAGILWTGYAALYDPFLRWKALREMGLPGLQASALPAWFYVAQAASPVAIYRALLIVWHKGFRDYEETAVLEGATLPAWMTTEFLSTFLAFVWVFIPLVAAWIVWTLRYDHDRKTLPVKNSAFLTRRPVVGRLLPLRKEAGLGTGDAPTRSGQKRARTAWNRVSGLVAGRTPSRPRSSEGMTSEPKTGATRDRTDKP